MSKKTTYQEGVLTFSGGRKVPFLCRPLSESFTPEEIASLGLENIEFFPEVDLADQIKDQVLKERLQGEGGLPGENENEEEGNLGWDDAY